MLLPYIKSLVILYNKNAPLTCNNKPMVPESKLIISFSIQIFVNHSDYVTAARLILLNLQFIRIY